MKNLSTQIKTYAMITFTGGHYMITEQQNEMLKKMNLSEKIVINNSVIHTKNIAEIMPIGQYYETFPDKRPVENYKNFSNINETLQSFSEQRRKKALQSIIKGFEKHFVGRIISAKSQAMLNKMKAKLL